MSAPRAFGRARSFQNPSAPSSCGGASAGCNDFGGRGEQTDVKRAVEWTTSVSTYAFEPVGVGGDLGGPFQNAHASQSLRSVREMLQACLNGTRTRAEHPAVPLTAQEIGREAAACVAAGADALHLHPRDADGRETLDARAVDAAVLAVRVSGGEISLTTGAWIEPDVDARLRAIASWRALPDVCSVNLPEEGAAEVCRALHARGIEVEAGLASVDDVERLGEVLGYCRRALVEVPDPDPQEAVAHARRIEAALPEGLARLLHGEEAATWAVVADARSRGLPFRIGLEDVLTLPDGSPAPGNGALVRAARS